MEQIAIYLRLSKEDEFVKDESNSITNQRAFIRGFLNKNKELRKMSVVEFVDDGYSGKNMDRPDMQRGYQLEWAGHQTPNKNNVLSRRNYHIHTKLHPLYRSLLFHWLSTKSTVDPNPQTENDRSPI